MVRYSNKVLDLLSMGEASDKEQRRASYYKKQLDQWNNSAQYDIPPRPFEYRRPFVHSSAYRRLNPKQYRKFVPTLPKIFEITSEAEFEAQSGFESLNLTNMVLDTLISQLGIKNSDDIVKEVEGLTLLFISISKSTDYKGALAILGLYIRDKFDTSISKQILSYITEIMDYNPQSGDEGADPSWLSFVKDVKSNWLQCKSSSFFKNFTRLLSVVVMSGLYRVSDLTFSIKGFKVIEPDMKTLCAGAGDLATAVVDITVYFCERVYYAIKTKSVRPFLVDSLETSDLEQEYCQIMQHWELYRSGNHEKVGQIKSQDLLGGLIDMKNKLSSMLPEARGIDKRVLETKYRECIKVLSEFQMIRGNAQFKRAPFSIEYFGLSSVGKSTFCEQTSHYLLSGADLDTSDIKKFIYVSGKKHWDGARSDMVELKIDDHANVKADFVESSPCDVIIRVCNNTPYSPPMAELANKGQVFIEPEIVSVTTNVEDLDAFTYSNNPVSIQRRMHYVVEVKVKPEFQKFIAGMPAGIDSSKVIASQTVDGIYSPPPYHDVWVVTVKQAVHQRASMMRATATYKVVEHEGKKLEDISMKQWLNFAAEKFAEHRAQQFNLETNQSNTSHVEKCGVDGCNQIKGYCMKHHDPQFGISAIKQYCQETSDSLLIEGRQFHDTFDWLPYLPDSVVDSKLFSTLYCFTKRNDILQTYKKYSIVNALFWVFINSAATFKSSEIVSLLCCGISTVFALFMQYVLVSRVRNSYVSELSSRHVMNEIHRNWRNRIGKTIMASSVMIGSIYMISKLYRKMYGKYTQGNLEPTTALDILQRDSEPNVWAAVAKRPLPCTQKSIEHTQDVVITKVKKNLLYASISGDDSPNYMGNVLFLCSNMLVMPDHYFTQIGSDSLKLVLRKENATCVGGSFTTRVDKCSSYLIPDTDLRVCYSSTGGSYGDILDYFPTGKIVDHSFQMFYRHKLGEIEHMYGRTRVGRVGHSLASFFGGEYADLSRSTFDGMCGAVLISENKQTCITGLHLGGRAGTKRGCFGSVTKQQLEEAIEHVSEVPGVIRTGNMGDFKPQVMGAKVLLDTALHPKSPVNFLPEGSQFEYFQSCVGATTSRSDVRQTPISQFVEEETGQENIWGKPKMHPEWEAYQKALENASHPAEPVPHDLLMKSIKDYRAPLLELAQQAPWCNESPLSDHENLCGRVGCKFIDAIPLGTSVGFPMTGPKRKYVIDLEPTAERPNNRELVPELAAYIEECEDIYKQGFRNHFVAKACKKDEVLALSKKKCRIFYANSFPFTFLIRKYFLPVVRFLQMNPLVAECAVGINCHGPEWDQFHEYVMTFGKDRLIGGDYGKYDQKLPSQKLIAALSILIDIASYMNYSAEDLYVMETMVGDIVYSMIAFNGDLVGIQSGTHISGNSLTVILNGISGSLNLRDYFYTNNDESIAFRDAVKLMTYGDDNIGTVSKDCDNFHIKGASQFLESTGQVYTMPDKESELREFLNPEDFEFLKRFSVYHPKLDCNVGALLDKSIIKSLHCYMRPKGCPLTPQEACAQNIDTSLREWFNHGENVYETRRAQMTRVAQKANITHMCTLLDQTYDDMVVDWKSKYA